MAAAVQISYTISSKGQIKSDTPGQLAVFWDYLISFWKKLATSNHRQAMSSSSRLPAENHTRQEESYS